MDHPRDSLILMQQTADERTIQQLYEYGLINQEGKNYALELISPPPRWGYWLAKLLKILGCALILSGLIFFFAANWQKMPPAHKFASLQVIILCCALGAWVYTLEKLTGQLFLTAACILVGIFLAVFGQIYQTGANSFELFLIWSLLILPWVAISHFAALWFIWLLLLNFSLGLFWEQTMADAQQKYLFVALSILNLIFLANREYWSSQFVWLQANWHRIVLVALLAIITLIPIERWIIEWPNEDYFQVLVAVPIQAGLFLFYRWKKKDNWSFTIMMISICIIISTLTYKILDHYFNASLKWLLMSISALAIFSIAMMVLKKMIFIVPRGHYENL